MFRTNLNGIASFRNHCLRVFLWCFVSHTLLGAAAMGSEYSLYGLCKDRQVFRFPSLLPKESKGIELFRVKDASVFEGDTLRSLSPHPSGGVEVLTGVHGSDDRTLIHLNKAGRVVSSIQISSVECAKMFGEGYDLLCAYSSKRKDYLALVGYKYIPKEKPRLSGETEPGAWSQGFKQDPKQKKSIQKPPIQERSVLWVGRLEGEKVNSSGGERLGAVAEASGGLLQYPTASWSPTTALFYYTDTAHTVIAYDPRSRQKDPVTNGRLLGILPGMDAIVVKSGEKNFFICNMKGEHRTPIITPRKLTRKRVWRMVPLPEGQGVLWATPRMIPLLDGALMYWKSDLDGSNLKKIGGTRGFVSNLCFSQ